MNAENLSSIPPNVLTKYEKILSEYKNNGYKIKLQHYGYAELVKMRTPVMVIGITIFVILMIVLIKYIGDVNIKALRAGVKPVSINNFAFPAMGLCVGALLCFFGVEKVTIRITETGNIEVNGEKIN